MLGINHTYPMPRMDGDCKKYTVYYDRCLEPGGCEDRHLTNKNETDIICHFDTTRAILKHLRESVQDPANDYLSYGTV